MNFEKLQKFLDENNLILEQYLRNNMITDEERKYIDKIWMDAIYKNFGEDTEVTDKEWETTLKSMNEGVKKWVDEEIFKIKYNIIKDLINKEDLKDD